MNARKLSESSALSDVRASTSSQMTASAGAPAAAPAARVAPAESDDSTVSIEMEPSRSTPS
jgi:hypothetical protein